MHSPSRLAKSFPLFFILFAFFPSLLFHISAQTIQSLAVLDLEGRGISSFEAASLTDRLRSELVNTGKVTIVERSQMEQILIEQDFQLTGCTSDECAVEVGQLLGVTTMVAGSVGKVGSTFSLDVRIIDVVTGKITHSIMRDYRGEIDGLLSEMGHLARTLAQVSSQEPVVQQPEPAIPSQPEPQESLQPAAAQPALEKTKETYLVGSKKKDREVSVPAPAGTEKIYTYMFGGGLYSSSWNKANFDPPTSSFSAGYYPRNFPENMPIGILPYNNRNIYFILEYATDKDFSSINLDSRYLIGSNLEVKGTYFERSWQDGDNTRSTLGLGTYFGESFLRYSLESRKYSYGSTTTTHNILYRLYQGDYSEINVRYSRRGDSGSDKDLRQSIELGARQLSPQWVYYKLSFTYDLLTQQQVRTDENANVIGIFTTKYTDYFLWGEVGYYPNRSLYTGFSLNLRYNPDREDNKLYPRTLSISVRKYWFDLLSLSLIYSQTTYPNDKSRSYNLNVAYLL